MMSYLYQDILIVNGDVVLDAGGNPVLIQDVAVIAQDIKHAILESGLAVELVGEKSPTLRADIKTQLELLVEDEPRLIAGTVDIMEPSLGTLWITAITRDFGPLNIEIKHDANTETQL